MFKPVLCLYLPGERIHPAGHFFLGYLVIFAVLLALAAALPERFAVYSKRAYAMYWLPVCILGGAWALVPDLNYFIPLGLTSDSPAANLFFGHGLLDRTSLINDLWFDVEVLLLLLALKFYGLVYVFDPAKCKAGLLAREREGEFLYMR